MKLILAPVLPIIRVELESNGVPHDRVDLDRGSGQMSPRSIDTGRGRAATGMAVRVVRVVRVVSVVRVVRVVVTQNFVWILE